MTTISTLSVGELAERLQTPERLLLLDCREADEWQFCRIDGAQHIPMSEIQQRAWELDPDEEIVVYCHHGIRSRSVAEYLVQSGFPRVANLAGGIDAWSMHVDPAVRRY